MASLELQHIDKIYTSGVQAVSDFNLSVQHGEFIVFVGPSGCGKSTTLRMIAGLEDITNGNLLIDNKRVNNLSPRERDIAMAFQNYALYGHMSVYHNMAFSLTLLKRPAEEIHEKVINAAKMLDLMPYLKRKPKQLSGGQRQRVALGRAIVRNPKVFLLDEPLSNLDAKLRDYARIELKDLHRKLGATFVYVTHDQTEAMTMADRIVIMNNGVIQQVGTPIEVYDNPVNVFVASFIGSPPMNIFDTHLDEQGCVDFEGEKIAIDTEHFAMLTAKGYVGKDIIIGIRPEEMLVGEAAKATAKSPFQAKLDLVEFIGNHTILYLKKGESTIIAKSHKNIEEHTYDTIEVAFRTRAIKFFDAETKERIYEGELA